MCATSYESLETLRRVYDNIDETLNELHELRVKVAFQVDATRLDETLFCQWEGMAGPLQFDRIVWNFPCAAVARGQDGQNQEMEHNKSMVRRFVSQSRHYLVPGGQIHMNHKTKVRVANGNIDVSIRAVQFIHMLHELTRGSVYM